MKKNVLWLLCFLPAVFACAGEEITTDDYIITTPSHDYVANPVASDAVEIGLDTSLTSGYVAGNINSAVDLDNHATILDGRTNSDEAIVDLVVERDEDAMMVRLMFDGAGLNHESLLPGNSLSFVRSEYDIGETDMWVTAVGCTGLYAYQWDYDAPADYLDLYVQGAMDGSRVVHYVAEWNNQGHDDVVSGYFTLSN